MKSLFRIAVPAACALALFACRERRETGRTERTGEGDKSGTTTLTGARYAAISNDTAVQRLVMARCEREAACNNIGADKRYADREVCTHELNAKMRDDLKASECPKGVDGKELDECIQAIHKESCNNPIDTISRIAACRTSDMCLKMDEKNR
jgi:hypothetical protein